MLAIMETIYDVLRLLVAKSRGALTDAELELARKIIDGHEAARPVPDKAKVAPDGQADT
jgi:hypothetical protein